MLSKGVCSKLATSNCKSPSQRRNTRMNNQSKCCKEKMDIDAVQIVMTLNDAPIEVRKKSANEPIYITHL